MRQTKLNQIIEERVLEKLTLKFQENGFKYKKSIKGFYKSENGILYEVTFYPEYKLFMNIIDDNNPNENFDDFYLTFEMYFETKIIEFEKWYKENFSKTDLQRVIPFYKRLEFAIPLNENIDFIIPDDFVLNQKTYFGEDKYIKQKLSNNIYQFSSWDMIEEIMDFDSHVDLVFSNLHEMISTKFDYLELYNIEERSKSMKYNALLIYDNQLELPTKFVTERYAKIKEEISNSTNEIEKEKLIKSLNRFISIGNKYLNLNINNPF